jgi:hypothetical protein
MVLGASSRNAAPALVVDADGGSEMRMSGTFARIGSALALATLLPAAASAQTLERHRPVVLGPGQAIVIEGDWWSPAAPTTQGRKDVLEVATPPPPQGPATPMPFCSPGQPFCQ